jgi:hypothetical protein
MQAGRIKSAVVYAYNSELIPSFFFITLLRDTICVPTLN